jgi:hypothetical protein
MRHKRDQEVSGSYHASFTDMPRELCLFYSPVSIRTRVRADGQCHFSISGSGEDSSCPEFTPALGPTQRSSQQTLRLLSGSKEAGA